MPYRDSPFQIVYADDTRSPLLQGKTAIVTGAGSDIGRGIALLFAREGANVIVADHHATAGEETVAAIEAAEGRACLYIGDAMDLKYHIALAAFAKHRYGWLDVAVNNACVGYPPKSVSRNPSATWGEITSASLSGLVYAVRAQIPSMIEAGGGVIVNLASFAAADIGGGNASTQGLIGLTKDIAAEYSGQGIRANIIVPERICARSASPDPAAGQGRIAVRRAVDLNKLVGEVAQVALFLASAQSRSVNGTCVPVNGASF